jgi:hypothetical protein
MSPDIFEYGTQGIEAHAAPLRTATELGEVVAVQPRDASATATLPSSRRSPHAAWPWRPPPARPFKFSRRREHRGVRHTAHG